MIISAEIIGTAGCGGHQIGELLPLDNMIYIIYNIRNRYIRSGYNKLVLGGGNTSVILASCAEHFKRLGGVCHKGRSIYAQPHQEQ